MVFVRGDVDFGRARVASGRDRERCRWVRALPRRGRAPPRRKRVPPRRERVPPRRERVPPRRERVLPRRGRVPPRRERVPPRRGRVLPRGGRVLPRGGRARALPPKGPMITKSEGCLQSRGTCSATATPEKSDDRPITFRRGGRLVHMASGQLNLRVERQRNPVADEVSALTSVVRPVLEATLYALKASVVQEAGGHENVSLAMWRGSTDPATGIAASALSGRSMTP